MPWELTLLKYDGVPPRFRRDADAQRELPLGTLHEVRNHISNALPGTAWYEELPLIEMMKANGSESWKTWDKEMIESASMPKLKAVYNAGGVCFEMFGFSQVGPLKHVLMEIRGNENPIPALRSLCDPKNWSVVEEGTEPEFIRLDGEAIDRWNKWQKYLNVAIQQSQLDNS